MINFIKEIFNAENLKKAMLCSSLSNPNVSSSQFVHLFNVFNDMDQENINKNTTNDLSIKKAA